MLAQGLSRVRFFVTPWTVACRLLHSWDFPGKNTGVGCHFLLQGIFPTQGSNSGLPHCRQTLYHLLVGQVLYILFLVDYIYIYTYIVLKYNTHTHI